MTKSVRPEKGDVLYTKVGTYGIPAFIDTDQEFAIYVSVCLIKPRHDLVNSRFLAYSMRLPYIKRQADRKIKGIGVPDLHLNQIRDFDIVLPSRDEQNNFVEFFMQVEQLKSRVRDGIAETQTLFDALTQKYFG
jgi:type I restriction enzyme S subunit